MDYTQGPLGIHLVYLLTRMQRCINVFPSYVRCIAHQCSMPRTGKGVHVVALSSWQLTLIHQSAQPDGDLFNDESMVNRKKSVPLVGTQSSSM